MRNLQRLITKAKNYIYQKAERLQMVWVTPKGNGTYEVSCHLWDGMLRSGGSSILTEHSTMKEVEAQIDKVAAEYPNRFEKVNVYYDDVEE